MKNQKLKYCRYFNGSLEMPKFNPKRPHDILFWSTELSWGGYNSDNPTYKNALYEAGLKDIADKNDGVPLSLKYALFEHFGRGGSYEPESPNLDRFRQIYDIYLQGGETNQ